jgi:hypothetical protein
LIAGAVLCVAPIVTARADSAGKTVLNPIVVTLGDATLARYLALGCVARVAR